MPPKNYKEQLINERAIRQTGGRSYASLADKKYIEQLYGRNKPPKGEQSKINCCLTMVAIALIGTACCGTTYLIAQHLNMIP